jgi:putative N6-adenine-specific DNA methylase
VTALDCYAVVAPGLEALTATELAGLGLAPTAVEPGGVSFTTNPLGLYAANLQLRTASRVLVRLASFEARGFAELEKRAKNLAWDQVLAPGAAATFRVTSKKSKLYHGRAIEERLVAVAGGGAEGRSGGGESQEFIVRVFRDRFTISADSSGALLHQRGYRLATAKAPLRETLGAAMLLGSGWDPTTPLVDPLCGSGTIAIEGALMARRIPPGRHRDFAFAQWPDFNPAAWQALLARADSQSSARAPAPILASDRDAGAIEAAIANATRAGVLADIDFRQAPVSSLRPPEGQGWLVTNPPYGVRVGEADRLRDLYARFGAVARQQFGGWTVAILSANRKLEGQTGLTWEECWRTRNGGIPVRLVRTRIPSQIETPAARRP